MAKTQNRTEALLGQLRAQRGLPPPNERRRIREAARVSHRQLGDAIGVAPMTIWRWEAGTRPRDPNHLHAYGRLLDELRHLGDGEAA
jgi:DNA-binding transcriptional regulator YiaG